MVNIFIDYYSFVITFKQILYHFNQEKIIFLMIYKSISFSKKKRNYLLKNLICKKKQILLCLRFCCIVAKRVSGALGLRYSLVCYVCPRNCKRPTFRCKKMRNYLACLCLICKDIMQLRQG